VAYPDPAREIFGPGTEVAVLGAFPDAVYATGTARMTGEEFLVAVISPQAVRLPGAVVTSGLASEASLLDLVGRSGVPGRVGGGCIRIGDLRVTVTGEALPRSPMRRAVPADALVSVMTIIAELAVVALRSAAAPEVLIERSEPLAVAARTADPAAAALAASGLLGYGPGLTPAGDDVLAGHLVAARRLGLCDVLTYLQPAIATIACGAARATTSLSRALLSQAAAGRAVPEIDDLLDAAALGEPVAASLTRLLALGHTSGAAIALGIATAAGVPNSIQGQAGR